jgi:hypothetical protein
MPVTNIKSTWSGGDLYFYEGAVGRSVTGDVLIVGDDAVTVGGTSQDIDFAWYATGSKSFVLDAGAGTLTIAGMDITLTGDLTIDTEDLNIGDGDDLEFGDSQDVLMRFSLADTSDPAFVLALDDTSQQMHITDKAAVATDWARSVGTHPEVAIHSNTTPITDYLAIGNHDGTTAHINVVGGTTLSLDIAGTAEVVIAAASTSPATSDSNALGTTALMWSDLFLASGAVINFNNGDATITHSSNLLTLGGAGLTVGASGAGFDVTLYGDTADCDFVWDQDGDTNGSLTLGTTGGSKGVDFTIYGDTNGNYLHWDRSADDLSIVGTAARVLHGADAAGNDVIFYGAVTGYAMTWDADGDTNGSLAVGADTKGVMFSLYGDVTGCGVFWNPSTDTNGTLTIGGTGGSKGNDVMIYGATSGAYVHWDQSTDDLYVVGAAQLLVTSGLLSVGADTVAGTLTLYPSTTARGITTVTMADNTGATTTNINVAAQAGARTLTIPDAGASANFVMMTAAQAVAGTLTRADLTEEALATYGIPVNQIMAADGAPLAVAETADDFFLSLETNYMELRGEEANNETETSVGYIQFILPPEYVSGGDVKIRFRCKLDGAGTDNSSTFDVEAYEMADGAVGSDICATSQVSFAAKSTYYDKDFTITAAGLVAGDILVFKFTATVIESASSALAFYSDPPKILLDIKG